MVGAGSTHGRYEECINILVANPEYKRPLGRRKRRWLGYMRTAVTETVWQGLDWIHLVQHMEQLPAPVNTVMNLRVL
jgi:hypothetical protein